MISLTRLNNEKIVVNAELIEFVEATPDTMLTTTTGKKVLVKESVDTVIELFIDFKRRCAPIVKKSE